LLATAFELPECDAGAGRDRRGIRRGRAAGLEGLRNETLQGLPYCIPVLL